MKKLLVPTTIIILTFGLLLACTATEKKQTREAEEEKPLEYKLAVIDAGGYVKEDDVTVIRFRYLLEELDKKTKNSKQEIANMTVKGQKILREKYGKEVKLLDLMEAANESIPPGASSLDLKYEEIMAFLVLRMAK